MVLYFLVEFQLFRCLGNIVTGSDSQTDAVLQNNAVPVFAKLLQYPKMNIVKVSISTGVIS